MSLPRIELKRKASPPRTLFRVESSPIQSLMIGSDVSLGSATDILVDPCQSPQNLTCNKVTHHNYRDLKQ